MVGLVPEQPEMLQLANGDIVESGPPTWGMDIKVYFLYYPSSVSKFIFDVIKLCRETRDYY